MTQNYTAQQKENNPLSSPSSFQFKLDLGLYYSREGKILKEKNILKSKFRFGFWVLKGPDSGDFRVI